MKYEGKVIDSFLKKYLRVVFVSFLSSFHLREEEINLNIRVKLADGGKEGVGGRGQIFRGGVAKFSEEEWPNFQRRSGQIFTGVAKFSEEEWPNF